MCSLLRRDASINFKAKGNSLVSVLACNLLMAAYEEDENWPEIFVKVRTTQTLKTQVPFVEQCFICGKCNFRCTLRTLLGKESGWTVLTARTLLTTSRLPLGQRCPRRACCCRLTLAALPVISAQVGFILTHRPVEQKNCYCSSPDHWATRWGSFCSVCRKQPSSLNPWWGWQSDWIAYRWGETQPWRWRAGYAKVWKLPMWMWGMLNIPNPTNTPWNSFRSSLGLNILF